MIVDQRSDQEVIEQVSSLQPPAKTKQDQKGAVSTVSANKKWSWKDEHVEALIGYIKDYKTLCDFKSIAFEADLKELYSAVCSSMARRFPSEFGPDKVTEPSTCVKDMFSEEYELYKETSKIMQEKSKFPEPMSVSSQRSKVFARTIEPPSVREQEVDVER